MRSLSLGAFLFFLLQAYLSLAQQTVTVTVIENSTRTTTIAQPPVTEAPGDREPGSTTTQTTTIRVSSSQAGYEAAASSGPNGIDVEGGASGSDTSSWSLSTGGLIAIVVVVLLVVIFGIASTVLFLVAKRRQWTMRQTLRRASRRLTGRSTAPTRSAADRRKRSGIVAGSNKAGTKAAYPAGHHERGLVVEVADVEKGGPDGRAPKRQREKTWIRKLWGNDWK